MTSNAGSHLVTDVGRAADAETLQKRVMEELRRPSAPSSSTASTTSSSSAALIARELDRIVDLQLERLRKLLRDRDLENRP